MQSAAISVECFPGQGRPVGIRIDRPVHAARVFEGKSPGQVLQLVPVLFAICGVAQTVAASHAIAAAAGEEPALPVRKARGALIRIEIAREHLWRALIDWPRFVRYEPAPTALAVMQSLMPKARRALFVDGLIDARQTVAVDEKALQSVLADLDQLLEAEIIGISPAEWLSFTTREELDDYRATASGVVPALLRMISTVNWDDACASQSDFLPSMPFADLEAEFVKGSASQFVELPDWQGRPRETSPLSRQLDAPLVNALRDQGDSGLLLRIIAAVTELAATSGEVSGILNNDLDTGIQSARVAEDTGIAQVEAARGRLVHRVVVRDKLIESYRVVAPTEWNFHPGGVVSRVLGCLSGDDRDRDQTMADLFITLMDPCVAHTVEVH